MSDSSSPIPSAAQNSEWDARPDAGSRKLWLRLLLFALAVLVTFLGLVTFPYAPPQEAPYEADPSLSLILSHAHEHGVQFGTRHAYTYGPLGYLIFFLHPVRDAWAHISVDLVIGLAVATGLCLVAQRLGRWTGILLIASLLWVAANTQTRTDFSLNIGLLCWGLLCVIWSGRKLAVAVIIFTIFAAFTALAKNSFLFVGTLSAVLIGCDLLVRGQHRLGLGMLVGFSLGFLAGWILAGQQPRNLPAFAGNALAMVHGYNEAVGWDPISLIGSLEVLLPSLVLLLVLLRTRLAFGAGRRDKLRVALVLSWLLTIGFAVWKHGIVRADACNLEMCFGWMALLALALDVLPAERRVAAMWARVLAFAVWLLALLPLQVAFFPGGTRSLAGLIETYQTNARRLLAPAAHLAQMKAVLGANRHAADMPRLRQIVGDQPIDVFGHRQAYALFNELNYQPRPAPQSYAACNADLMRLNEQFFLSSRSPGFVLFELGPLDRKFATLPDARLLRHLLVNYEPVAMEGSFLLLKKTSAQAAKLKLLSQGTVGIGEQIDLRGLEDAPLWIEIDLTPTWRGWLRRVFLRPSTPRLAVWRENDMGLIERGQAPSSMLSAGFLANPLLLQTDDVLSLYAGQAVIQPGGYSIDLMPGHSRFWKDQVRFRIYRVENPFGRCTSAQAALFMASLGMTNQTGSHFSKASSGARVARTFTAFGSNARWRPTQPPPGNPSETAAFILLMSLPLLAGGALILMRLRVKRRNMPVRWTTVLLGNALVLLLLVSVAVFAGEVYFRFFYDTTDSLGYTRVCERWVERHWRINQAGCRDNIPYRAEISPGKRRISFVGDSFTAGHGIKRVEDRFPNLLGASHKDHEIHVLAKVGLDTGAELALLERLQKKDYKFNQLVLVYCLNDIGDLFPSSPAPPPSAQILMELEEASWIVRNSYFLNLAYHRYKAARNPVLRDYYPHIADAYRGVLWERQKVRFTQIRDFVRSNGGRLSVVTFPFLHALGPDYEYEFAHENLSEAWRELGVPHLDLLEVYKDIPTRKLVVNAYDAHPNEYANELAARAIDQFLFNPPPSGNQCGESKTDR